MSVSTSAHVCNEWTEDRAGKAGEIGTTSHDQRRISFTDAVLGKPRFRVSLTTRQNAVDAPLSKHKDIAMVSICHTVKVLLPSPGGGPKYSFPNITLFAPQSQTAPYLQTGGAPAS